MTLDELEKLCQAATPDNKPLNYSGISLDMSDADLDWLHAARTYMPKLLAAARAAKDYNDHCPCVGLTYQGNHSVKCSGLRKALAALESPYFESLEAF